MKNYKLTNAAFLSKSYDELKNLLEKNIALDYKDSYGNSLLHGLKSVKKAKLLIKHNINVNALNNNLQSPLHTCPSLQVAIELLDAGATLNIRDKDGRTPLHLALIENNTAFIKLLIYHGADINCVDFNQDSLVHTAVKKNQVEILKLLIKAGANINALDNNQESPLYLAVKYNQTEILKLLIKAGANVNISNKKKNTPLFYVNSFQAALLLINAKADINVVNYNEQSPLCFILEYFQDNELPNSKLIEIIQVFAAKGFDINSDSRILESAVDFGDVKIIQTLLFEGANPNLTDSESDSPLFYSNPETATFLIAAGARFNLKRYAELLLDEIDENNLKEELIESNRKLFYTLKEFKENPSLIKIEKDRFEALKQSYLEKKSKNLRELHSTDSIINNDENEISDTKTEQNPPLKEEKTQIMNEKPSPKENLINESPSLKKEQTLNEPSDTQTINSTDLNNSKEKKEVKAEKIDKMLLLQEISNDEQFWSFIHKQDYSILEKLQLLGIKELYNKKNAEGTPLLQVLVKQKQLSWLKTLIDAGADPNVADAKGNSVLHSAILENTGAAFVRLLLQNKARVEDKNDAGLNCYQLALQKENLLEKEVILDLLAS